MLSWQRKEGQRQRLNTTKTNTIQEQRLYKYFYEYESQNTIQIKHNFRNFMSVGISWFGFYFTGPVNPVDFKQTIFFKCQFQKLTWFNVYEQDSSKDIKKDFFTDIYSSLISLRKNISNHMCFIFYILLLARSFEVK